MARNVELLDKDENVIHPKTSAKAVVMSDERSLQEHIGELESDMFSPIITQTSSMARLGEGDSVDVSDNVEAGYFESAVLRGQTLVNVHTQTVGVQTLKCTHRWSQYNINYADNIMTSDKTYLYIFDVISNTANSSVLWRNTYNEMTQEGYTLPPGALGRTVFKFKHIVNSVQPHRYNWVEFVDILESYSGEIQFTLAIIEYQEGMENWNIPYFTGISSVKNPVLTTTGKNLIDVSKVYDEIPSYGNILEKIDNGFILDGFYYATIPVSIKQGTVVYGSFTSEYISGAEGNSSWKFRYIDDTLTSARSPNGSFITLEKDVKNLMVYVGTSSASRTKRKITNIQIENGNIKTPYEPYKSNTLSPLEELELLSEESTLDLINGEVYELFEKITLDGTNVNFTYLEGYSPYDVACFEARLYFDYNLEEHGLVGKVICDKLPQSDASLYATSEGIQVQYRHLNLMIYKSSLTSLDANGINEYLTKNNLSVILPKKYLHLLKTVSLSGSPIGFKDGHIQLSSKGLTPTLEYSVPTSRTGQVTQNSTLLVKHGKQIGELELRLAQSGVTAVYDQAMLNFEMGVMSAAAETSVNYDNFITLIESGLHDNIKLQEIANMLYLHAQLSDAQYQDIMSRIQ